MAVPGNRGGVAVAASASAYSPPLPCGPQAVPGLRHLTAIRTAHAHTSGLSMAQLNELAEIMDEIIRRMAPPRLGAANELNTGEPSTLTCGSPLPLYSSYVNQELAARHLPAFRNSMNMNDSGRAVVVLRWVFCMAESPAVQTPCDFVLRLSDLVLCITFCYLASAGNMVGSTLLPASPPAPSVSLTHSSCTQPLPGRHAAPRILNIAGSARPA